ncbi:MAG: MBOAT family O-acyltransferase [Bacteroidia bacterium]
MIFNSVTYILFLALAVLLYWVLPRNAGRMMLFLGSLVFYGFWRFEFIPLLILAAVIDYWCSIRIEETHNKTRKNYLIFSLCVNLGILFYFKYLTFFAGNVIWALDFFGCRIAVPHLDIILPLGISFYTFETISYTVDVYRGHIKAERNFLNYATFLVYFPHLIAGPVLRASEILPQLNTKKTFRHEYLVEGIKRIIQGLFLKVVLADNISPFVDLGFSIPTAELSAIDVTTLAFMFGFQIYFDFSAYSHIAIGSAKMMGIEFPENFNYPYAAASFKDFWKRWHISLSSWIRDYLYLPLMKAKVRGDGSTGIGSALSDEGPPRRNKHVALFITWAIMGLWHGANWTFIFWGVYHAGFVFIERIVDKFRKREELRRGFTRLLNWMIVLPIAMLGWIPFRASNMHTVWAMYSKFFSFHQYKYLGMKENIYLICALLVLFASLSFLYKRYLSEKVKQLTALSVLLNICAYTFMIILVFTFLRPISQFIYFQF